MAAAASSSTGVAPCVKVAVVGAARVGKTAFIRQVCDATFTSAYEETKEFAVSECLLEDPAPSSSNAKVRLQFWDVGASVLAASASRKARLYEGALIVLVLYDVTDYDSFVHATTVQFNEVTTRAPKALVLLIGCKTDLAAANRVVEVEEARRFVNRHNVYFMEVSSADGTNVQLTATLLRIRAMFMTSGTPTTPAAPITPVAPPSAATSPAAASVAALLASTATGTGTTAGGATSPASRTGAPLTIAQLLQQPLGELSSAAAAATTPGPPPVSSAPPPPTTDATAPVPPPSAAASSLQPADAIRDASGRAFSLTPVSRSYDSINAILGRAPREEGATSPSAIQALTDRLLQMSTSAKGSTAQHEHPATAAAGQLSPAHTATSSALPGDGASDAGPALDAASSVGAYSAQADSSVGDTTWLSRPPSYSNPAVAARLGMAAQPPPPPPVTPGAQALLAGPLASFATVSPTFGTYPGAAEGADPVAAAQAAAKAALASADSARRSLVASQSLASMSGMLGTTPGGGNQPAFTPHSLPATPSFGSLSSLGSNASLMSLTAGLRDLGGAAATPAMPTIAETPGSAAPSTSSSPATASAAATATTDAGQPESAALQAASAVSSRYEELKRQLASVVGGLPGTTMAPVGPVTAPPGAVAQPGAGAGVAPPSGGLSTPVASISLSELLPAKKNGKSNGHSRANGKPKTVRLAAPPGRRRRGREGATRNGGGGGGGGGEGSGGPSQVLTKHTGTLAKSRGRIGSMSRVGDAVTFQPLTPHGRAAMADGTPTAGAPHASTRKPLLYIEVNLGQGQVGQVEVRQGDNAFKLAEAFVEEHGITSKVFVDKLGHLIEARVAQFCESEVSRQEHQRRRAAKKEASKWLHRRTVPVGFNLATDKRPEARANKRQLIGRLHIEVGHGKVGCIQVRLGDDPHKLVGNFLRTYGIAPGSEVAIAILDRVERQLVAAKTEALLAASQQQQGNGDGSTTAKPPRTRKPRTGRRSPASTRQQPAAAPPQAPEPTPAPVAIINGWHPAGDSSDGGEGAGATNGVVQPPPPRTQRSAAAAESHRKQRRRQRQRSRSRKRGGSRSPARGKRSNGHDSDVGSGSGSTPQPQADAATLLAQSAEEPAAFAPSPTAAPVYPSVTPGANPPATVPSHSAVEAAQGEQEPLPSPLPQLPNGGSHVRRTSALAQAGVPMPVRAEEEEHEAAEAGAPQEALRNKGEGSAAPSAGDGVDGGDDSGDDNDDDARDDDDIREAVAAARPGLTRRQAALFARTMGSPHPGSAPSGASVPAAPAPAAATRSQVPSAVAAARQRAQPQAPPPARPPSSTSSTPAMPFPSAAAAGLRPFSTPAATPASTGGPPSSTRGRERGQAPSTGGAKERAVLFKLKIDIGAGGEAPSIVVRRGDRVSDLAAKFVSSHGLDSAHVPRVQQLLLQNIKIHRERRSAQRQFR